MTRTARVLAALAFILVSGVACTKDVPSSSTATPTNVATPPAAPVPTPAPVIPAAPAKVVNVTEPKLEWTAKQQGADLRIDYIVTNPGPDVRYVVDQLVVPTKGNRWTRSPRVTVMKDGPGNVKIALAAISSDRPSSTLYTPMYRKIEPGQQWAGTLVIPMPLEAWNPVGGALALEPDSKTAVLMVQTFAGEPKSWKTLDSGDAEALVTPEGFAPSMLRVGPQPLP